MKIKPLLIFLLLLCSHLVLVAQADTSAINAIKRNYKEINAIKKWSRIDSLDVWGMSTQGGMARFYYDGNTLKKIDVWLYGEMGKLYSELYILNGDISFNYEKDYQYNSSIYEDSISAAKDHLEVWDYKKTVITEDRTYFDGGKMKMWIDNKKNTFMIRNETFVDEERDVLHLYDGVNQLGERKRDNQTNDVK